MSFLSLNLCEMLGMGIFMSENSINEGMIQEGVHGYNTDDKWVRPDDPLLLERLEWFKDQKLGLMMHWGPYSQIGVIESWELSDDDASWAREGTDWDKDSSELKRRYFDLNKTFNPIRFQPEAWADIAAEAGFKYLIFTTKHHDGFCMWDTHTTDYKITDSDCPFHTNRYADICKNVFDAFRAKNIAISAYFSKADWHTPYYWAPGMERSIPSWRGASYTPSEYPWLWDKFVNFTHEQIMELMSQYGRIDILWLDAGWVSPAEGEDIRLAEVVEKAREIQPWLISADRTVGGKFENYFTPEQTVPPEPIFVPWESCITLGSAFSFRYEDEYKPLRQLVQLLVGIVAKGGNLALNIAPQPDGRLPKGAIVRLKELGAWLQVYGEAIYGTRVCEPYSSGNCHFTKKDDFVYCFYLYSSEDAAVEENIFIPYGKKIEQIDLIGSATGLKYEYCNGGISVGIPPLQGTDKAPIAHVLRMK